MIQYNIWPHLNLPVQFAKISAGLIHQLPRRPIIWHSAVNLHLRTLAYIGLQEGQQGVWGGDLGGLVCLGEHCSVFWRLWCHWGRFFLAPFYAKLSLYERHSHLCLLFLFGWACPSIFFRQAEWKCKFSVHLYCK